MPRLTDSLVALKRYPTLQMLCGFEIMTYSYKSDWSRAGVKTSLRQCGEQLLNVLRQNRSSEKVGRIVPDLHHSSLLRVTIGDSTTASVYWT